MAAESGTFATRIDGPATEMAVSRDMIKRGVIVAPVVVAVCAVIWGADGAWSAAYGMAIVLTNFLIAAGLISFTASISLGLMMGAVLFGYLVRLGLIFLAVWLVQDATWISFPALGATIIVTHLGLLIWEMKYVAISLAYPGLKPEHDTPARTAPHPDATSPNSPSRSDRTAPLIAEPPTSSPTVTND